MVVAFNSNRLIINISRPETLDQAKKIVDFVEDHEDQISLSRFYYLMKDALAEGRIISASGFKFQFGFESEALANEFKSFVY